MTTIADKHSAPKATDGSWFSCGQNGQQARWTTSIVLSLVSLVIGAGTASGEVEPLGQSDDERFHAAHPLDALRLLDFDESQLRLFVDGSPLTRDEFEPLQRLLYVFPRLDWALREPWRQTVTDWAPFVDAPSSHRAAMVEVFGLAGQPIKHSLSAEAARRFGYQQMYEIPVQSSVDGADLSVWCRSIPSAWQNALGSLSENPAPIRCDALFLKVGADRTRGERRPTIVLATDHVAWLPDQPNAPLDVTPGKAMLGAAGMDIGLLETVVQRKPLEAADRECFYQMLWAVGRMSPQQFPPEAPVNVLPIATLLQNPASASGDQLRLRGTIRRALRIQVNDSDILRKYGMGEYYEAELFANMEQTVKLRDPRDGSVLDYHRFPITVCLPHWPEDMPLGDGIRVDVVLDAFVMKLRTYRSQFVDQAEGSETATNETRQRFQLSPLLIGAQLRPADVSHERDPWPVIGLATVVFGGCLLVFGARLWYARADRDFQRWRRKHEMPRQIEPWD